MKVAVKVEFESDVLEQLLGDTWGDRNHVRRYVVHLVKMMAERQARDGFTLDDVMERLDRIIELHTKKPDKKQTKLSPYDCDIPEELDRSLWEAWITHLHKSDIKINAYMAQQQADKLKELSEDFDISMLLRKLIDDGAKKIYLPFEWSR